jgi:hypothetical protein
MIPFVFLVAAAVVLLLAGWLTIKGHADPVSDTAELGGRIRPVDLQAFNTLVDPADEAYLQSKLSRRDFRRVQRMRLRAAVEYLKWTGDNAAVLLRLGEAASRSEDATIATSGRQLANTALGVRINCILATYKLYAGLLFPGQPLSLQSVLDGYVKMRGCFEMLALAQHPASQHAAVLN